MSGIHYVLKQKNVRNPALDWKMEVKDGKRMINGLPAEEFIAKLPRKEFFMVILAGISKLHDFSAEGSQEPDKKA